jgi:uncharacterized membrane protein
MAALADSDVVAPRSGRALHWAGHLVGFSLGGFFDGILLHQILQWHHLLSALEGEAFRDLRVQVLADGLFHLLMYGIALVGLWLLWRSRRAFAASGAGRLLAADALVGFGVWHVVDSIVSHWLIGIHHIRMDSDVPLAWDLLWFAAFGIVPLALGWRLRRDSGAGGPPGGGRLHAPVLLAAAVLAAGPVAALPPRNADAVLVLFRPGTSAGQALAAVEAAGGRVVWTDASGDLWAVDLVHSGEARLFYRHGALLVSRSLLPAGCFAWSRAA